MRRDRWVILTAILISVCLAILALGGEQRTAEAHTPNPAYCDRVWQQAEPGGKWSAKQRCLAAQRRHVTHFHRPLLGPTKATWYGPGFYGNGTACGYHYTIRHRGVAVPSAGKYWLPCNTKLTICRRGKCVRVRITDTGGFRDHRFDLSARTAMDLCRCWAPYTMSVKWKKGW